MNPISNYELDRKVKLDLELGLGKLNSILSFWQLSVWIRRSCRIVCAIICCLFFILYVIMTATKKMWQSWTKRCRLWIESEIYISSSRHLSTTLSPAVCLVAIVTVKAAAAGLAWRNYNLMSSLYHPTFEWSKNIITLVCPSLKRNAV